VTIAEIYREALMLLRATHHEEEEARAIARILTDEAAGARFSHLSQPEKVLDEATTARWREQLNRVAWGEPLPYVLGRQEFCGLEFECDRRALIPRPETELLVEFAKTRLEDYPAPLVADLGTGSGCIAVALAHFLPQAEVWATDISESALELARSNAQKHGIEGRMHFRQGQNAAWAMPLEELKFDAVLSNPPYIPLREIETLQLSVRRHEPHTALDGGDDGLDCYRQLAAQCRTLLNDSGFFACELGAGQWDEVKTIFQSAGWAVDAPLHDLQEIPRVLIAH
jgi:release factor glutamine methyltransferase